MELKSIESLSSEDPFWDAITSLTSLTCLHFFSHLTFPNSNFFVKIEAVLESCLDGIHYLAFAASCH